MDINSIFSIAELYDWSINITDSMIVWNKQWFKTFDKTTLKISTTRCFDCCVNQPAMNMQKLYIKIKANVVVTMNDSNKNININIHNYNGDMGN
jgi:hypothetical protein